jgi:HD-GYP domain-containing protein (c-di-GMP phosphodiesterase class II)
VADGFLALAVHGQPEALGEIVELLSGPALKVETARSSTEAMLKIRSTDYAVIITGHKPPVLDGLELLERSVAYLPDAMRIILESGGVAPDLDRRMAVAPGSIFRVVATHRERGNLSGLVAEGLKLLTLVREQRDLVQKLGTEYDKLQKREKLLDVVVKERTKELQESYERLKRANRQALFGLAEAIEAKDAYTKGHCGRVAGYPDDGLETLEFGSFLHDIGKIGVKDAVLLKPGPLDEDEWEHMRSHPVMGYEIASQIDMLRPIMPAVRNHHERWDGKGYPDGLVGQDIPLSARLVAIADAYDALATDRPYKTALPLEQCEALLRNNAGKMFDPDLVEMFCARHLGTLYRQDYEGITPIGAHGADGADDADDPEGATRPQTGDTGGADERDDADDDNASSRASVRISSK